MGQGSARRDGTGAEAGAWWQNERGETSETGFDAVSTRRPAWGAGNAAELTHTER